MSDGQSDGRSDGVSDGQLRVLGIDGTTGRPLDALSEDLARRWVRRLRRTRPPRYGVATGDLRQAGWGVVFAEGVPSAVRDALAPLLARRRRQAGRRFRELTYRPGEGATDFRTRLRAGLGRVDPRRLPWYLLLVGSPVDLPHGFELDLDVPHAVGRLAFDHADDLAAYAQRVVDAEEASLGREPRSDLRVTVFAPTHVGDLSTAICVRHLADPLAKLLHRRRRWRTTVEIGESATRARLLELIEDRPDLLVAVAHAVSFPPGHRHQRRRQGALVCADWPGPTAWPRAIPAAHTVAADDLPAGALADGIALLYGCHTVGTPRRDPYDSEDPDGARLLTDRPFVAAAAQRLLGRDGGALAVIGHVGRAFEASVLWRGVSQIGAIEDAVRALLDGRRLGVALDGFGQRFADLALTWIRTRIEPEAEEPDPLTLWIAFHDAHSWSLLGDPAVRLPRVARRGRR